MRVICSVSPGKGRPTVKYNYVENIMSNVQLEYRERTTLIRLLQWNELVQNGLVSSESVTVVLHNWFVNYL